MPFLSFVQKRLFADEDRVTAGDGLRSARHGLEHGHRFVKTTVAGEQPDRSSNRSVVLQRRCGTL
jgi:hypothetical protein